MARQPDVDRHGQPCPACGRPGCHGQHREGPASPPASPPAGPWGQLSFDDDQEVEQS